MYKNLDLDLLVPHPHNVNKISRRFAKKLRHNIEQIGMYETLTVRPYPRLKGKFEVLNGHARLETLRKLGISTAKCDIWDVSDEQAELFLAILNRLRGSDVPELRMNLLLKLLRDHPIAELAAHIPETVSYLEKLDALGECAEAEPHDESVPRSDIVIVDFYLDPERHRVVSAALDNLIRKHGLSDSSQALARMAELSLKEAVVR